MHLQSQLSFAFIVWRLRIKLPAIVIAALRTTMTSLFQFFTLKMLVNHAWNTSTNKRISDAQIVFILRALQTEITMRIKETRPVVKVKVKSTVAADKRRRGRVTGKLIDGRLRSGCTGVCQRPTGGTMGWIEQLRRRFGTLTALLHFSAPLQQDV